MKTRSSKQIRFLAMLCLAACATLPVGSAQPQELDIHTYAGLTIIGEIGKVYSIEYVTDLTDTAESDWRCLEYLQLPASPYLWADKSAPATGEAVLPGGGDGSADEHGVHPAGDVPDGEPDERGGPLGLGRSADGRDISRGYWMGKYEVTQGEYLAVMGNNPSWFNGVAPDDWRAPDYGTDLTRPVETVSWDDAMAYCAALTERERVAGRIAPNSVYRSADGGGVGVCVSGVDVDAVQLWG